MINRRRFVGALGASALLSPLAKAHTTADDASSEAGSASRSRVSLNGEWERYIGGDLYDIVQVPSSQHPVGFYHLKRNFLLPRLKPSERAILHFDGITYHGRAFVNEKELGTMAPYVPCEFEFTQQAKEGPNIVEVAIADLVPEPGGAGKPELFLGVNPGWEAYGGLIRDVFVEVRPAAYIENVRFAYTLNRDYSQAICRIGVVISSSAKTNLGQVELILLKGKAEVARARKAAQIDPGTSQPELSFSVEAPSLWSPEQPHLYELRVSLRTDSGEDMWNCRTGFREVVTRGPEFLLNGKPLVLNGVCRHDMWKEQGFTLTRRQMEQDMRMIKELGCNFVRLVHYPHHRYIVELADELGLFVSEEPGYWNMDFTTMPRSAAELGYRIMERVIRRDWNSPSVFAWLLANECTLTVEYLRAGKELCDRLDPIRRLVSAANSMSKEKAKPIFEQAGMDFFDQHPYTFDLDEFNREAEFDGSGKPLTFTEWGGKAIGQSQIPMQNTVDRLLDLVEAKQLAGHVFWSWQDMRQYSRIDGEMRNGVLESGVVTEGREPRAVVDLELARLFKGQRHEDEPVDTRPQECPLRWSPWSRQNKFRPVDLQPLVDGADGRKAWADLETRMAKFWSRSDQWKRTGEKLLLWQGSDIQIASVLFRNPVANKHARPVIVSPEFPEVTIPVGEQCVRLHILGHVTLPTGFPAEGRDGETVASYTLHFASGKARQIPLRNGREVARSNLVHVATRIDAEASEAQRALLFVKDVAREQYQVLLFSIPLPTDKLESITCRIEGEQPPFAIFAVTAEVA